MLKKITLVFLIIINLFNLNINENTSIIDKTPQKNITPIKELTPLKNNTTILEKKINNIATLIINNKTYPLYEQSSAENTVEKNVQILNNSTIPPTKETNIYLAAHSGEGSIAYFNALFNLHENDIIQLNYNKITYTYQITSIKNQLKDGTIEIQKDNNTNLILTTCSNEKNKQLVIISTLKESI